MASELVIRRQVYWLGSAIDYARSDSNLVAAALENVRFFNPHARSRITPHQRDFQLHRPSRQPVRPWIQLKRAAMRRQVFSDQATLCQIGRRLRFFK